MTTVPRPERELSTTKQRKGGIPRFRSVEEAADQMSKSPLTKQGNLRNLCNPICVIRGSDRLTPVVEQNSPIRNGHSNNLDVKLAAARRTASSLFDMQFNTTARTPESLFVDPLRCFHFLRLPLSRVALTDLERLSPLSRSARA